jgi:hypothetical protein
MRHIVTGLLMSVRTAGILLLLFGIALMVSSFAHADDDQAPPPAPPFFCQNCTLLMQCMAGGGCFCFAGGTCQPNPNPPPECDCF